MSLQSFEDATVGDTRTFGSYTVTKAEIIEFAEQYDPQPFHTDETAAQESMFGELVASGWHTAAMTMRMLVDHELEDSNTLGSTGIDELRWPTPVRPGDVLSVRREIIDTEPEWREGLGRVQSHVETHNDDGEVVLSMIGNGIYPMAETS
ncbi:MAG: MaoC family dehydratase [Halobacteriales archaeon]